jgi:hypothetical protein
MAKYCPKHDITGDECWCCEEEEINKSGLREQKYSDPVFLQKRGGGSLGAHQANSVIAKFSKLSPQQVDRLIELLNKESGGAREAVPVATD